MLFFVYFCPFQIHTLSVYSVLKISKSEYRMYYTSSIPHHRITIPAPYPLTVCIRLEILQERIAFFLLSYGRVTPMTGIHNCLLWQCHQTLGYRFYQRRIRPTFQVSASNRPLKQRVARYQPRCRWYVKTQSAARMSWRMYYSDFIVAQHQNISIFQIFAQFLSFYLKRQSKHPSLLAHSCKQSLVVGMRHR